MPANKHWQRDRSALDLFSEGQLTIASGRPDRNRIFAGLDHGFKGGFALVRGGETITSVP